MKNLLLIIIVLLYSCNKNGAKYIDVKSSSKNYVVDTVKKSKDDSNRVKMPTDLSLPFCFKIDTSFVSDYYQTNLDSFLSHHHLTKDNTLIQNKKFHQQTEDFVSEQQANFMHYPYHGKAYAIAKVPVNREITAVFYAYLFDSEMIQPRVEIQTFDNVGSNIDNLIIASTFSSECSGYRDFCINQNKNFIISDFYYCSDINVEYKNRYTYKINDAGKFVLIAKQ